MKLCVQPIYGWGWRDTLQSIDAPDLLDLDVSILETGSPFRSALGQVERIPHPLSELWVLLTQRHVVNDGTYNLSAFKEKPASSQVPEAYITGFAEAITLS